MILKVKMSKKDYNSLVKSCKGIENKSLVTLFKEQSNYPFYKTPKKIQEGLSSSGSKIAKIVSISSNLLSRYYTAKLDIDSATSQGRVVINNITESKARLILEIAYCESTCKGYIANFAVVDQDNPSAKSAIVKL